ncbi:MAG TPA: hypothetical protein VHO00_04850 [Actinomycetes bacterium]|nr:hypothetical protein [Actinomycetes bacterium]
MARRGAPARARPPRLVRIAAWILAGYGALLALIALDAGGAVLVIGAALLGLAFLLWSGRRPGYYVGTVGAALFAGFVLLGAIANFDGTALVICVFAVVPLVMLLLPAARRPDRPAPVAERPAGVDALSAPEGWTRELAGGRVKFWFLGLIAVISLVGGILMLTAREWIPGLAVASFGLAGLTVLPMFRSWRRRARPRTATIRLRDEPGAGPRRTVTGTSFPFSSLKSRAAILAAFFFGVTCLLMVISAPEFADSSGETWTVRIVGLAGAVFFLGGSLFAVIARGAGRGWGVLLLPDSVIVRHGPAHARLPWDSIATVEAYETTVYTRGGPVHEPFIRVIPDDPGAISGDRTDQAIRQLLASIGDDLTFPIRALEAEPRLLYHVLRYYHANPSDRAELGTARAIERITSGRASVRAQ